MLRQVFGSHELVKFVPQCSRQSVATLGGPVLHMHWYIVFRKRLRYRTVFFTDGEYATRRSNCRLKGASAEQEILEILLKLTSMILKLLVPRDNSSLLFG